MSAPAFNGTRRARFAELVVLSLLSTACAEGTGPDDVANRETCGNGVQDSGEPCDDGIQNTGATCDDGIQNGGETSIDCGGPCGEPVPWALDGDGDGFAVGDAIIACKQPAADYARDVPSTDCNDDAASVYPGAPEHWGDCVDSNCDGLDFTTGDGRDGELVVSNEQELVARTSLLAAAASQSATSIVVADTAGIESGAIVLIHAVTGPEAGRYEVAEVDEKDGNTLHLRAPLRYGFPAENLVVVSEVPQFTNVLLAPGATLRPPAWNGLSGGTLAFVASGVVSIGLESQLQATGAGYQGGAGGQRGSIAGRQGESVLGEGAALVGANDTGGGGSRCARFRKADAGGGGHATAGQDGASVYDTTTPGDGGEAASDGVLDLLLFGGGGGGGCVNAEDNAGALGGSGGAGGGLVVVATNSLALLGTLAADGAPGDLGDRGNSDWAPGNGGGGAGGAIFLEARSIDADSGLISTRGGARANTASGGDGLVRLLTPQPLESVPAATPSCPAAEAGE